MNLPAFNVFSSPVWFSSVHHTRTHTSIHFSSFSPAILSSPNQFVQMPFNFSIIQLSAVSCLACEPGQFSSLHILSIFTRTWFNSTHYVSCHLFCGQVQLVNLSQVEFTCRSLTWPAVQLSAVHMALILFLAFFSVRFFLLIILTYPFSSSAVWLHSVIIPLVLSSNKVQFHPSESACLPASA